MRIVHISDIHLGSHDPVILEALGNDIRSLLPDLVLVSGDLTQRARSAQFIAARSFIESLQAPWLSIPGNHDIPMYNIVERFFFPLSAYKHYISKTLNPVLITNTTAIVGLNTARSATIKDGRINEEQANLVRKTFYELPHDILKILMIHHPVKTPATVDNDLLLEEAEKAIGLMQECGVHLVVTGHTHLASAISYDYSNGNKFVAVQASTACSVRTRGEKNSYNVIEQFGTSVSIISRVYQNETFVPSLNGQTTYNF